MKLPIEELEKIKFFEVKPSIQTGHNSYQDHIKVHYEDQEYEYKLFGFPIYSYTESGKTRTFKFNRLTKLDEDDNYYFQASEAFNTLYNQLDAYFGARRVKYLLDQLKYHESEYLKEVLL